MESPTPYWHPEADYSGSPFFIRRMDTRNSVKAAEIPVATLPMTGFIYLNAGVVLVEVEDQSFFCEAGHLLLIPENRPFAIRHYSGAVGYTGGFQSSMFRSAPSMHFLNDPLQQAFWFDTAAFVGELFNMLTISFERGDTAFIEKGIDLLLTRIRKDSRTYLPELVSDFLDALFSEERKILTASEYAQERGISLNYLNRMVKQATGHPVSSWIDSARLNLTKRLLRDTSSPIAEIAAAAGMYDQAYFARFFRKRTGMTPSQFRKLMHA